MAEWRVCCLVPDRAAAQAHTNPALDERTLVWNCSGTDIAEPRALDSCVVGYPSIHEVPRRDRRPDPGGPMREADILAALEAEFDDDGRTA